MSADNILQWVEQELKEGRNDTVHDFLAYLAEQMIEMNKAKNAEIRDFLKWLEREIGAGIEGLTNKTAVKEYHENEFNRLLEVLKKNKKNMSLDPSDREQQELLERYFKKSLDVLGPLKARIKATDDLIDDIVYRLYGLTGQEIGIVVGRNINCNP